MWQDVTAVSRTTCTGSKLRKTRSAADSSTAHMELWHLVKTGCFRLPGAGFEPVLNVNSTAVKALPNITHTLTRVRLTSWGVFGQVASDARAWVYRYSCATAQKRQTALHTNQRQYMYD